MNYDLAKNVLQVIDAGLSSGIGEPIPGKMCVEAAVCYALSEPHGDAPTCVARSVRRLAIDLNDARWSSDHARAKGLRRLGVAQLGTSGTLDEGEFVRRVATLVVQRYVPIALRAAASVHPVPAHRAALEEAAKKCESEPSPASLAAARDTAFSASSNGLAAAFDCLSFCLSFDAASGISETSFEFGAAAEVAEVAAEASVAVGGIGALDAVLGEFAEDVVQILCEMGAPGCQFLHLTEESTKSENEKA